MNIIHKFPTQSDIRSADLSDHNPADFIAIIKILLQHSRKLFHYTSNPTDKWSSKDLERLKVSFYLN